MYITHHRYKGIGICGKELNIPYGTILNVKQDICLVTLQGDEVCYTTSENSKMHFAINNDGKGLERGSLTYFIAYSELDHFPRFNEEESDYIYKNYDKWLMKDLDVIRFNNDFYTADIDELKKLADYLGQKWKSRSKQKK